MQALCPDNTYGVDSGGDPRVIPKLTFEEFKVCFKNNDKKLLLWYIEITTSNKESLLKKINLNKESGTSVWLLGVCVHH
jgi:Zn-dependent M16 (insulinase) family peptidase